MRHKLPTQFYHVLLLVLSTPTWSLGSAWRLPVPICFGRKTVATPRFLHGRRVAWNIPFWSQSWIWARTPALHRSPRHPAQGQKPPGGKTAVNAQLRRASSVSARSSEAQRCAPRSDRRPAVHDMSHVMSQKQGEGERERGGERERERERERDRESEREFV